MLGTEYGLSSALHHFDLLLFAYSFLLLKTSTESFGRTLVIPICSGSDLLFDLNLLKNVDTRGSFLAGSSSSHGAQWLQQDVPHEEMRVDAW